MPLSAKEIRELIQEKIDGIEAINAIAEEDDGRDLTEEEQGQVEALMNEIGQPSKDDQPATGLHGQLERAERFETMRDTFRDRRSGPGHTKQTQQQQRPAAVPRVVGRLRAFQGENAAQDAHDCGMWLRAVLFENEEAQDYCADRGIDVRAAQTEGTDSAGGYTVPDPLAAAVINVRERVGAARQVSRIVGMTSDTLALPKRSSGQTVYYPGEATAITASDKAYTVVSLTAVKRAVLTKVSNELIGDSLINVVDDVAVEAGHALAYQEDNEFINGDGTATYGSETGLITGIGAAGKHTLGSGETAWSNVVLTDFNELMGLLPDKFWMDPDLYWVMRRNFYAEVVQKLLYAAGGNTVQTIEGATRPALMGYPIAFTDRMPADAANKACCFFGNFRAGVVIGDRQSIQLAASTDYAFDEDVLTLRLTSRYDINFHENGDGSNAGAVVGMFTAAT